MSASRDRAASEGGSAGRQRSLRHVAALAQAGCPRLRHLELCGKFVTSLGLRVLCKRGGSVASQRVAASVRGEDTLGRRAPPMEERQLPPSVRPACLPLSLCFWVPLTP